MHSNVLLAHRGQPDPVILVRVLLAADTEHADVEQPDGGGEHSFSLKVVGPLELASQTSAKPWQLVGELEHPLELRAIAVLAPPLVVQVLPAARGVDAGGLKVTRRVGADPHILPSRRDHEIANAREVLGRLNTPTLGVDIAEASAAAKDRKST